MDASASTKQDADTKSVYGYFDKIEDSNYYPLQLRQNNTVIKYTKIPDFEFDSKVSWPPHSYSLQPRLRRIISLDEDDLINTKRSLKSTIAPLVTEPKMLSTNYTKRKIITISEDNDSNIRNKSKEKKYPVKTVSRSSEADFKDKQTSHRTTSRLTSSSKFSKEIKTSAKLNSANNKKEVNVTQQNRSKHSTNITAENAKIKYNKEKEFTQKSRNPNPTSKISISKNFVTSSESEKELSKIKSILYDNLKSNLPTYKKSAEKSRPIKSPNQQSKPRVTFLKDTKSKTNPSTVIHVPLEEKNINRNKDSNASCKVDCSSDTLDFIQYKNVNIGTDPASSVNKITTTDDFHRTDTVYKCESTVQTELINEMFDSLEIPNVTLTKDKCEPKEDTKIIPMPNVAATSLEIQEVFPPSSPHREELNSSDLSISKSSSYIISRATLTYTTRQKINFHVVGNEENIETSQSPSLIDYPVNVVSVYKNNIKKKKVNGKHLSDNTSNKKKSNTQTKYINCLNELKTFNCSYDFNKLMKPSEIISTIRVNNGLIQSDYICEQFQRELNFIDSFFESLQYLESCSLSDKSYNENKVENFVSNSVLFDSEFGAKNSEYDNFLAKIENGANIDDTVTMASKSLCLLNLLIRDEQRRAKNLLFVLKMREDALKDFTKSQILWLEKKKKHDNTDISTLKKKQRGALLKLQHECGEMQRMRKALLTLSEKRKIALMKTKKNIELKLNDNVDVEQIILGKKKLKRSLSLDRNSAPLKCFDLSSSGCEESTTSKQNSDATLPLAEVCASLTTVTSAEKCVQTSDLLNLSVMDHSTDTAAENFVVVDGGYLNILFHNLTLPQIFSSGKQYEVNEEALRNIVNSANNHNTAMIGTDIVEKIMDQIKNKEPERSSTPSTARSLLEEFDQYYKNLTEDKSSGSSEEREYSSNVYEIKDSMQSLEMGEEYCGGSSSTLAYCSGVNTKIFEDTNSMTLEVPCVCESLVTIESDSFLDIEPVTASQTPTGPLPVPVGAAAVADSQPLDVPIWLPPNSTPSSESDTDSISSQPLSGSSSTLTTLATPVHSEAEELRRQQLAIEREIKALEQQQCRLLVVREIPDKPPPPYTPPTETRNSKLPRNFAPDESTQYKIHSHITDPDGASYDPTDAFDMFVKDFCQESLEKHKHELSDKPWDSCNLLPQKPQVEIQKLVDKTSDDLKEVLTNVAPQTVSGVSSRRSDHIDDILFAEWRRCEPEWTALHTDEAIVKNQLFESIFQKILNDTIDEYKKTVHCPTDADE